MMLWQCIGYGRCAGNGDGRLDGDSDGRRDNGNRDGWADNNALTMDSVTAM